MKGCNPKGGIRRLASRLAALFLLFGCVVPPSPHPLPGLDWTPEEERQLVDLSGTLTSLDGEEFSLVGLKPEGKVLFLNLWATWCLPCQEEMPAMASLYQRLSDQGLAMVAVTDEDPATVGRFLEDHPYPFTVLLDPENMLGQRFGVLTIPTTLVVDSRGGLALRHSGAYPWDTPEMIEQFLAMLPQH